MPQVPSRSQALNSWDVIAVQIERCYSGTQGDLEQTGQRAKGGTHSRLIINLKGSRLTLN